MRDLESRLDDLACAPDAPPAPAELLGLVRHRRRTRQLMRAGAGVAAIALAGAAVWIIASQSAPPPRQPDQPILVARPAMPTALHLRDFYLQTGELPVETGAPAPRPARALDSVNPARFDPSLVTTSSSRAPEASHPVTSIATSSSTVVGAMHAISVHA
ncbi:MAG: hypothetical protein ACF8R7_03245 [Phycisphaerales bacterium JB039]